MTSRRITVRPTIDGSGKSTSNIKKKDQSPVRPKLYGSRRTPGPKMKKVQVNPLTSRRIKKDPSQTKAIWIGKKLTPNIKKDPSQTKAIWMES